MNIQRLSLLPLSLLLFSGCSDSRSPEEKTPPSGLDGAPVIATNTFPRAKTDEQGTAGAEPAKKVPVIDVLATARETRPLLPAIEAVLRGVRETLVSVTNGWKGPTTDATQIYPASRVRDYAVKYEESTERALGFPPKPDISDYLPGCEPFPVEIPADITATNLLRTARHRILTARSPEEAVSIYRDVLDTEMQVHTLFSLDARYTCDGTAAGLLGSYWKIGHETRLLEIWEQTEDETTRSRWERIKNAKGPFEGVALSFANGFAHLALNPAFDPGDRNDSPDLVLLGTAPSKSFSWDGHDYILFDCRPFNDMCGDRERFYIGRIDKGRLTAYYPISNGTFEGEFEGVANGVLRVRPSKDEQIRLPLPEPGVMIPAWIGTRGLSHGEAVLREAEGFRPFEECSAAVIERTRVALEEITNNWTAPVAGKLPMPTAEQVRELTSDHWPEYHRHYEGLVEFPEPIPGFEPFYVDQVYQISASNLASVARCRMRMAKSPQEALSIYRDVVATETHCHALFQFNQRYVCMGSGYGNYLDEERVGQECRAIRNWEETEDEETRRRWERVKNAEGFFGDVYLSFESGTTYAAMNPSFDPRIEGKDPWITIFRTIPSWAFTVQGHDYFVFKQYQVADGSGDSYEYHVALIENETIVRHAKICGKNFREDYLAVEGTDLLFGDKETPFRTRLPLPPIPARRGDPQRH